jgi:hypothetical protein
VSQLDGYAERRRAQLPVAPPDLLTAYMRWGPWIAIVAGALGVLFSIGGLFMSAVIGGYLMMFGYYPASLGLAAVIGSAAALLSSALALIGGYQMLRFSSVGWWLLAVGLALSLLSGPAHGSILSLIVVLAIAYVHLQVKPNYR